MGWRGGSKNFALLLCFRKHNILKGHCMICKMLGTINHKSCNHEV